MSDSIVRAVPGFAQRLPFRPCVRRLRAASVGPQLDDHDLACVATKDALGRERCDDLVARGAVMSYEDAVPYALRELDALLASLS